MVNENNAAFNDDKYGGSDLNTLLMAQAKDKDIKRMNQFG